MKRTLMIAALCTTACGAEDPTNSAPRAASDRGSPDAAVAIEDTGSSARSIDGGAVDAGTVGPVDAGAEGGADATSSGTAPTWTADIVPLMRRCTGYCHPGSYAPMSLDNNDGYDNLVNAPSVQCADSRMRVVPGDAEGSYLMNKLTGRDLCGGRQMPPSSTPLTAAELDLFRRWINGGALR